MQKRAILLFLAAFLAGCGAEHEAKHVILISIDTLRADHLGSYGYGQKTTPVLDALSQDSIVFEWAIAHAPSTLPSHASMFTSQIPQHHRASYKDLSPVADGTPTLASALTENGFRTISYNGGVQIDKAFGMAQGFETYESLDQEETSTIVGRAIDWLNDERKPEDRFFLFLHTFEIHHPYEPKQEFLVAGNPPYTGELPVETSVALLREINDDGKQVSAADVEHIKAAYDAEIRSMDHALGRLFGYLKEHDLYDDTLIVFTSDHGEEFSEHGFVGWHSHTLYDELLRVPLIVKLPGSRNAGARVATQVRGIDYAPSILHELAIELPTTFRGTPVFDLPDAKEQPVLPAVSWRDYGFANPMSEESSIRVPPWKLWDGNLHKLDTDPGELEDASVDYPIVTDKLESELARIIAANDPAKQEAIEPSAELEERLRSLGYVQ